MKKFLFLVAFGSIVWNCTKPVPPEPQKTLAILSVSALPSVNALALTANISSNGNSTITERGCYVSSVAGQHTESATCTKFIVVGNDIFTKTVENLISNTNYYITAYAVNEVGTAYSLEIVAKTGLKPPVFSAISIADITKNSARLFGTFEVFAGSIPTSIGLEYKLSDNGVTPVGEIIKTQSVAFTGTTPGTYNFEFLFTDGAPGQIYFVKAYCILPDTKLYGSEKFFTLDGWKIGKWYSINGVQLKCFRVWDNAEMGRLGNPNPLIDPTAPTPGMPGYDYENYYTPTGDNGFNNTVAIATAVPLSGINQYGAIRLAYNSTYAGLDAWFIPSVSEWEEIASNKESIFTNQAEMYNYFQRHSICTSSQIETGLYYRFSFMDWNQTTDIILEESVMVKGTNGSIGSSYEFTDLSFSTAKPLIN